MHRRAETFSKQQTAGDPDSQRQVADLKMNVETRDVTRAGRSIFSFPSRKMTYCTFSDARSWSSSGATGKHERRSK